ncbi:PKD domain-containing protein [Georgenia sp. MJ173]|uniref:PKD domain-containing protein n=1 Tax=Georgenia sunbinii TaxID=3117728 RepID=UPI002F266D2D
MGFVLAVGAVTPAVIAAAHNGEDHAQEVEATNAFDKVPLVTEGLADPFELDIADDGRVVYVQRTGEVKVIDQETLAQTTALDMEYGTEHLTQSDGLLGLALDNDFTENGWLYLQYSDKDVAEMHVSRFTMGEDGTIDPASESVLFSFPIWRGEGRANSHMGGSVAMGPDGNLYVATGDNTDPFEQSGYTPIDEREGRRAFDAQATSGNTNDLRGKILRVTPEDDGTYSIPEGNLFEPGQELTRPEVYGMGFRNPFRITIDPETSAVMIGDYGPDARSASPARGPEGLVEYIRMTEPANHGWPYCHGYNQAYIDYDYATGESGEAFDCANLVNDSPNNTGLAELPPAQEPQVAYGYGDSEEWPELEAGGAAPMGGPVYRYDPEVDAVGQFPESYDGEWFVYEYARHYFKTLTIDEDTNTVTDIQPFMETDDPNHNAFLAPFDAEFGPDGSLYVIEFGRGSGAGRGSTNEGAGIYRIDYAADGRRPVAEIGFDVDSGHSPLEITFSGEGSYSPEGHEVTYEWDFENDGEVDSAEANPTHIYTEDGTHTARLTVTDSEGVTGVTTRPITVGNTRPEVAFEHPRNGGFAELADTIDYSVNVTDAEDGSTADGTIECERVTVDAQLGHDEHAHPLDNYEGCEGSLFLDPADHGVGQNVFPVLGAAYTDLGGDLELVGQESIQLQVRDKEAEFQHVDASGVSVTSRDSARGSQLVTDIDDGDYIGYGPVSLTGIEGLTLGALSGAHDTQIDVRVDSPDGPLLGSVQVAAGDGGVVSPTIAIDDAPDETTVLYLVFSGLADDATEDLLELDWLVFHGRGVANDIAPEISATVTEGAGELEFSFDGSAVAPEGREIVSYEWDFGDGNTASGAEATHTYAVDGSYTARLIVTDSEQTREWLPVEVTPTVPGDGDDGGSGSGVPIEATVPELGGDGEDGALVLSVADFGASVDLGQALNAGDRWRFSGELPTVSVTDSRAAQGASDGWSVTGQTTDFAHTSGELSGSHLGWVPGQLEDKVGVTPGAAVAGELSGGPGLAVPATLASAVGEGRLGSTELGADLVLETPVDAASGVYASTVTLSLFPVD